VRQAFALFDLKEGFSGLGSWSRNACKYQDRPGHEGDSIAARARQEELMGLIAVAADEIAAMDARISSENREQ